jgi:hypothetical protein
LPELDNKQKDAAVAAYCIDCGTAPMLTVAMQVISPSASEDYKNSAYANVEQILLDLVFQYNDMLDIRDNEIRRDYDEEMFCEKSFNKVFGVDYAMQDAGHRHSDFRGVK